MSYLFDTSAARAVGGKHLQDARSKDFVLLLSPISFCELICHIGDEQFDRTCGNVRKVQLFSILDDPLAEIAKDVACPDAVNRTRFDDQEAVLAILATLDHVTTYAELAARNITVRGEVREIGDIAAKTQAVFDTERVLFVASLRKRCEDYFAKYGSKAATLAGKQFANASTDLAQALKDDMTKVGCDVTFESLASRTIIGAGYTVARACSYINNGAALADIKIDGNDLEDYFISLYLGLGSDRVLVTNDKGTSAAINHTLAALREHAAEGAYSFATNVKVMTSQEFIDCVETWRPTTQ